MRGLQVIATAVGVGLSVACNPPLPGGPSAALMPVGQVQSVLTAVLGSGRGGVSVTPKSIPAATMAVDISVIVAGARPNTTYLVQRAADVFRGKADGICQRALGLSPWSPADPPAQAFTSFPLGNGVATLSTDADGAGKVSFGYVSEMVAAGTIFDVMFRLVDNESAATTELRSGCFAVMVV
jgi:hypothetical protein